MRLSVFGLGYVGCVSAACFAREGHSVIGVDINETKVRLVSDGRSPIVEAGIDELVADMVRTGALRATTSADEAVAESDLSLICVGTPGQPNGRIDLTHILAVCREIGTAIRNKDGYHIVVVRSTVLPGTTEEYIIPAIAEASGKTLGAGFDVCVNPEFLREGTAIKDFYDPPFTLIGGTSAEATARVAELYAGIDAPTHIVEIGAAEMVKYACNSFHGLKVAFANEIGNVCKALGIDSHRVMRIFCEDTKLNISPAYLRPGFAFGGSCLPKDLRAITYRARQLDVATPVLDAIMVSNRQQIERAADMVLRAGNRRVGVLGLSFKEGTDDLRESPMVALAEILIGKGMQLAIYDPLVSQAGLMGANREFIERHIPHIWSLMHESLDSVIDQSDTLVLGSRGHELASVPAERLARHIVIDLVRPRGVDGAGAAAYQGICW